MYQDFCRLFISETTCLPIEAIHTYCGGNLTVSGVKATAGIFATYPAPYLSLLGGFIDQVAIKPEQLSSLPFSLLMGDVYVVCALGVWNSHAAALPHGSDRPEEQTSPSGQRAYHSRSPGVAHWNFPGQQQRLCHKPHQRHRP